MAIPIGLQNIREIATPVRALVRNDTEREGLICKSLGVEETQFLVGNSDVYSIGNP